MDALTERVYTAKAANAELERLIADYMPFIKRTVNDAATLGMDYDDRLSLAMLTFMNCVHQYDEEKGSFTGFAAACIRNRLIDENRKQARYAGKIIPLFPDGEGENDIAAAETIEDRVSIAAYNQEREKERLSEEIDMISEQLAEFGIAFAELPRICPKHERARTQCIDMGRYASENDAMRETLFKSRRLMQSSLARQFGLSEKTIEKHRKYIITIVIILAGDYPCIRAFLPLA